MELGIGPAWDSIRVLFWVKPSTVGEAVLVDEVIPLAVASPGGRECGRGDGEVQLWDFQTALGLGEAGMNV